MGWSGCEGRAFISSSSSLLGFLLFLLLAVCDDVADVLVVDVAGHIWGEGGPQVLHLRDDERITRRFYYLISIYRERGCKLLHSAKRSGSLLTSNQSIMV